jgi:hypothetical protein
LNWNTKPRLRFTTLQPTLLPGTTPKPSSTTSTRPHIALQPTVPTEAPKYYTTTPTYYNEAQKSLLCPELLNHQDS